MAHSIAKENLVWSNPLALLIQGGLARRRGDDAGAAELISQAIEGFEASDMALYAAAARRRLGEIQGGDRGSMLIKQAGDWMGRQQIKNPVAVTNLMAPGFTEPKPR
jgi:hypothetical protein